MKDKIAKIKKSQKAQDLGALVGGTFIFDYDKFFYVRKKDKSKQTVWKTLGLLDIEVYYSNKWQVGNSGDWKIKKL